MSDTFITRRQLLAAGLSLAVLVGCGSSSSSISGNLIAGASPAPSPAPPVPSPSPSPSPTAGAAPFPQPVVRTSQAGLLDTSLTAQLAVSDVGGQSVTTRTFEGFIGGPTLRVNPGDTLRIKLINDLPVNPDQNTVYPDMNTPHQFNSTNVHTHGLHVSPSGNSDNIFVDILPGDSFQYEYQIPATHPAGTYFYHPHKHGGVSMQMFGGMGAALIIQGGLDKVPEIAAARDLVFLINELNIDPKTGMVPNFVPPVGTAPFPLTQRILTVNGLLLPILNVQPGEVVRLRVINSTVRALIPFSIDGHDLNVVALDGVTLNSVRTVSSTTGQPLAAANRSDILIQAQAPGTYAIRKLADSGNAGLPAGAADPEVILAYMTVAGEPLTMALPTTLPGAGMPDIQSSEITGTRTLTFGQPPGGTGPPAAPGGTGNYAPFTINNERFDPNVINQSIQLNSVEEWTLLNSAPEDHPFHIHINPFQVVSINGVPLPQPEWHDTIDIPKATTKGPGTVVIRSRFLDFTGLYVLHCHILVHEDTGMMQTVNVF